MCKNQILNWHVLYTRPNQEKNVCAALQNLGIEVFLPSQKVVRQWSDRKKKIVIPLFPNYLFVNVSAKRRYDVFKAGGIVSYVSKPNGGVESVDNEVIDNIKKMISGQLEVSNERFIDGQRVYIKTGSFKGLSGFLVRKEGTNKLAIYIDCIKQSLLLSIGAEDVEVLD